MRAVRTRSAVTRRSLFRVRATEHATGRVVAFLWTPESGMRRLADALSEHGLDLSGWTLQRATGLSASGRTVVGWGTNPSGDTEGFVATLPARVIPTPSLGSSASLSWSPRWSPPLPRLCGAGSAHTPRP